MRMILGAAAASLMLATAALAAPPAAPAGSTVSIDGAAGPAAGRALYVYDRDTATTSACTGPCVASWAPVTPAAGAQASGDWTIITRPDGARQWAYRGRPVYAFFRDKADGQASGDNKVPGWRALK